MGGRVFKQQPTADTAVQQYRFLMGNLYRELFTRKVTPPPVCYNIISSLVLDVALGPRNNPAAALSPGTTTRDGSNVDQATAGSWIVVHRRGHRRRHEWQWDGASGQSQSECFVGPFLSLGRRASSARPLRRRRRRTTVPPPAMMVFEKVRVFSRSFFSLVQCSVYRSGMLSVDGNNRRDAVKGLWHAV